MLRSVSLLCLLLIQTAQAGSTQIWATWELPLGDHPAPSAFVVSVTSPTDTPVPPALVVRYAACAIRYPGLGPYCALLGCPPTGTYEFRVQAQYEEGLSAFSPLARCVIPADSRVCTCVATEDSPTIPVVTTTPPTMPPVSQVPDVPQAPIEVSLTAPPDDLSTLQPPPDDIATSLPQPAENDPYLQPVGEVPPLAQAPPIPRPWGTK